jgi:hypothetical protein
MLVPFGQFTLYHKVANAFSLSSSALYSSQEEGWCTDHLILQHLLKLVRAMSFISMMSFRCILFEKYF